DGIDEFEQTIINAVMAAIQTTEDLRGRLTLLQLSGDEEATLAHNRALELEGLNATNTALMKAIHLEEDLHAARFVVQDDITSQYYAELELARAFEETNTSIQSFIDELNVVPMAFSAVGSTLSGIVGRIADAESLEDIQDLEAEINSYYGNATTTITDHFAEVAEKLNEKLDLSRTLDGVNDSIQSFIDELNVIPLAFNEIGSTLAEIAGRIGAAGSVEDIQGLEAELRQYHSNSLTAISTEYDARAKNANTASNAEKEVLQTRIDLLQAEHNAIAELSAFVKSVRDQILIESSSIDILYATMQEEFTTLSNDLSVDNAKVAIDAANMYLDMFESKATSSADLAYERGITSVQFGSLEASQTEATLDDLIARLDSSDDRLESTLSRISASENASIAALNRSTTEALEDLQVASNALGLNTEALEDAIEHSAKSEEAAINQLKIDTGAALEKLQEASDTIAPDLSATIEELKATSIEYLGQDSDIVTWLGSLQEVGAEQLTYDEFMKQAQTSLAYATIDAINESGTGTTAALQLATEASVSAGIEVATVVMGTTNAVLTGTSTIASAISSIDVRPVVNVPAPVPPVIPPVKFVNTPIAPLDYMRGDYTNIGPIRSISTDGYSTGGFTGTGIGQRDETGFRVAGIVHEDEWVAPKWMVDGNPELFNTLETSRAKGFADGGYTGATPIARFTPSDNRGVLGGILKELQETRRVNAEMAQELADMKQMQLRQTANSDRSLQTQRATLDELITQRD
ncbi:MAG: hypothetical protein U9Q16_01390, partial [Patescibacteria group bacterium]|nr:hypothetical protein [Patescibacteria group bacterium]